MKRVPNKVFSFALKIALFNDSPAFRLDFYRSFYNLDLYGKAFAIAQRLLDKNLDYAQYSVLNLLPQDCLDKSFRFYQQIKLDKSLINLYNIMKELYSKDGNERLFGCSYILYKENLLANELGLKCSI